MGRIAGKRRLLAGTMASFCHMYVFTNRIGRQAARKLLWNYGYLDKDIPKNRNASMRIKKPHALLGDLIEPRESEKFRMI
jgi:hypothetical protein